MIRSPLGKKLPFVVLLAGTLVSCQEGERTPEAASDAETRYLAVVSGINARTGAPQITVEEAQQRLQTGQPTVFLDIRERGEHEVSAIKDAIWIPPSGVDDATVEADKDALLVTYCTAGYRSGLAAVKLSEKLGRPVLNLNGGLIAWFNSGGVVMDAQGDPTATIHTYSDDWAQYVTR